MRHFHGVGCTFRFLATTSLSMGILLILCVRATSNCLLIMTVTRIPYTRIISLMLHDSTFIVHPQFDILFCSFSLRLERFTLEFHEYWVAFFSFSQIFDVKEIHNGSIVKGTPCWSFFNYSLSKIFRIILTYSQMVQKLNYESVWQFGFYQCHDLSLSPPLNIRLL